MISRKLGNIRHSQRLGKTYQTYASQNEHTECDVYQQTKEPHHSDRTDDLETRQSGKEETKATVKTSTY